MKKFTFIVSGAAFAFLSIFFIASVQAATIHVTTTLDEFPDVVGAAGCAPATNNCSLREAITAVNLGIEVGGCGAGDGNNDTIVLEGLTYTLTCQGYDDENFVGDLDIQTDVRIEGIPGETVVDAGGLSPLVVGENQPDRVFHIVPQVTECAACSTGLPDILGIESFATVTMFGMRITNGDVLSNGFNGNCNGGGILNHGVLTVQQVEVVNNDACNGGGIANEPFFDDHGDEAQEVGGTGPFSNPQLTVLQSQINNNDALFNGGGISSTNFLVTGGSESIAGGQGGRFPTLDIQDSLIQGNDAGSSGGGVYLFLSTFSMDQSTVDSNTAMHRGGGIARESAIAVSLDPAGDPEDPILTFISNSTISRNRLVELVANSSGVSGSVDAQAFDGAGGGISLVVQGAFHVISNSTISNNEAITRGGGLFVEVPIFSPGATVEGAGILLPNTVTLYNVTIAENVVTATGGGTIGIFGAGGGIFHEPAECIVDGPCLPNDPVALGEVPPSVTIFNSLIAKNQAETGPDCYNSLASGGFNLIGDTTDCTIVDQSLIIIIISAAEEVSAQAEGDQLGGDGNPVIDPMIGPLQNNGGPTETHALAADSPAVDTANDIEGCQSVEVDGTSIILDRDQRDNPRPIAVRNPDAPICDIGAFELLIFDFAVTKADSLAGEDAELGQDFTWTVQVTNTGVVAAPNVTLTDPLPLGCGVFGVIFAGVETDHGSCSEAAGTVSCNLGSLDVGETATVLIHVVACGPDVDGERHAIENVVSVTSGDDGSLGFLTKTAQDGITIKADFLSGTCLCNKNSAVRGMDGQRAIYGAGALLLMLTWLGWRRRAKQGH